MPGVARGDECHPAEYLQRRLHRFISDIVPEVKSYGRHARAARLSFSLN